MDDGERRTRRPGSSTSPSGSCRAAASTRFSYADVASELAVTKASLHYHYPGKAELGEALIARYAQRFAEALKAIDEQAGDAPARLAAYASIYGDVLRERADVPVRHARRRLRDAAAADAGGGDPLLRREHRLAGGRDRAGRADGTLRPSGSPEEAAQALLGGLEGAMLVARPYGDVKRFEAAAAGLLTSITAPA